MAARGHVPVMLAEVMALLSPQPGEVAVDGTVGLGGHSRAIGLALGPSGHLIGIDRDPEALALAHRALADLPCRVTLRQGSFAAAPSLLAAAGVAKVDVALLDLGVSSLQLDEPRRGFSFIRDGPLDMRMDPGQPLTAAAWLARASVEEMARAFRDYGNERFARRIARRIAEIRSQETIHTTGRLAAIVRGAVPGRGRLDPATRVFQAIRIAVNSELEELERGLEALL
ncbi:MAG: 16S rRNA (cytosine(1402)-N(4))-methyltransferase RsmH, partial [Planctomycetota bacterium]|nr:16S rRNA (cytosine(1402)-N(4))-methyltransferase RsmH [Planctomycetota bacterium]